MSSNKTAEQLIQEVHQAVFGIPHTEEKGLCGDLKEIKEWLKIQNGKQRKLERNFWILASLVAGISGSGGFGIFKLLGGG